MWTYSLLHTHKLVNKLGYSTTDVTVKYILHDKTGTEANIILIKLVQISV